MNNIGDAINSTAQGSKPFTPTYLNLEYIFQKILNFFHGASSSSSGSISTGGAGSFGFMLKVLLFILALFFIFVIAYCLVRIFEIREKEKRHLAHEIAEYAEKQKEKNEHLVNPGGAMNQKWQSVLTHVFSENEADWKVALIEADVMLEELITELGFKGEGLGEKLKSADQEKFPQLTLAWEAHIIRNRIAHEGSDFELTQREAKRIVTIYEDIFRTYGFI